MKKVISMAMGLMLVLGMSNAAVFAADEDVTVYVSVSDAEGKLVLTQEAIKVTDTDNDGALTINDALYAAHEAKYNGGAEAGYASAQSEYGISLNKLWGTANGGSYGYYVNNVSAMSLSTEIKNGDYLNAYVYTDLTAWSDTYCYFDVSTISAETEKTITLTLSAAGYDANWSPVVLPVENATITINGETTEYKTDANGVVTFAIDEEGTYVISATSQDQTLVPPVCTLTVTAEEEENNMNTGDSNDVILYGIFAGVAVILLVILVVLGKKKK